MPRPTERTNGRAKTKDERSVQVLRDHSPPVNLEVEKACLGMTMYNPECLHEVVEITQPGEFFRDIHQTIAGVIWDQYGAGLPCDPLSISEALVRKGQLVEIGGDVYLSELVEMVVSSANAAYYAHIVHDKFVNRRIIEVANSATHRAYSNTSTSDELLESIESEIFAIADSRAESNIGLIGPAVAGALQRLESRREGVAGVPSGIIGLDDLTDGWQAGQVIIIGARPSMGKTAFACNIIEHAAMVAQETVLFVSLEMTKTEIAERFISGRTRIGSHRLKQVNRLGERDMAAIGQAFAEFRELPVWIDDTPTRTALKIAAAARRIKARQGLGLIVVDYLQLVDTEDNRDTREEKVAKISRRLKVLGRELKVPVIVLSQLNRNVENREDRRPRMSDLRESGAIEQDADVVILLHRPEYYDPNDQPGVAEVILAKNRNGATSTIKTTFLKDIGRFENLAERVEDVPGAAY